MATNYNTHLSSIQPHTWKIAFVFAFLALLVDGADLMLLSYSLNSIKADFGLSSVQAGMLGSFTLAGMAVGGIFGGWACDKFGRVRIVVISILTFSLLTCGLGFTQSFLEFGLLRFFASRTRLALYCLQYLDGGICTHTLPYNGIGYLTSRLDGWLYCCNATRWMDYSRSWRRMLFYVAIVPVLIAVLMHLLVPEPLAWQQSRLQQPTHDKNSEETSAFKLIFKDKRNRNMFILWALTAGFLQFGYYGVNNWMPSYLESELGMKFKEMTAYMVGTYTAMILGKVLAGMMADKLGRRFTYAFGAIGTAIFLPLIVFYNSPSNILYLLIAFGFLYGIPYGVNATYMTESFPTAIRGTAIGGAYNVGRLGAALAPATIGYLASGGSIGLGFVVMGAAYLICGVIPALFIKEKLYDPQKS